MHIPSTRFLFVNRHKNNISATWGLISDHNGRIEVIQTGLIGPATGETKINDDSLNTHLSEAAVKAGVLPQNIIVR